MHLIINNLSDKMHQLQTSITIFHYFDYFSAFQIHERDADNIEAKAVLAEAKALDFLNPCPHPERKLSDPSPVKNKK